MNPASSSPFIHAAAVEDAEAIARIHVETWRAAYAGILPAKVLADLSIERRTERWRDILTKQPRSALIAEIDGSIAGWTSFGTCRDAGDELEAEIYAIYVAPAGQRRGCGSALMAAAEALLAIRIPSAKRCSLWVLERNAPTRRFYERRGYQAGTRRKEEAIGGETFVELRYEKSLARPQQPAFTATN